MRTGPARALRGILLALLATPALSASLVEEARVVWRDDDPSHGGVSGIEVSADGGTALTLGDRGVFASAALERDVRGRLTGVRTLERVPVRDTEGRARRGIDAEGLAYRDDGRIYASIEGPSRVWTWRDPGSEAAWMPRAPGFRQLSGNGGLEALAIDAEGRLWTAAETEGGALWVYDGEWRVAGNLPGDDGFRIVGADFGPDGALWLLERRFGGLAFASRIRRLEVAGDRVVSNGIVMRSLPGLYGNLEGISVWRGADGAIRVTAVSDDNFLAFVPTVIVEWRLEG